MGEFSRVPWEVEHEAPEESASTTEDVDASADQVIGIGSRLFREPTVEPKEGEVVSLAKATSGQIAESPEQQTLKEEIQKSIELLDKMDLLEEADAEGNLAKPLVQDRVINLLIEQGLISENRKDEITAELLIYAKLVTKPLTREMVAEERQGHALELIGVMISEYKESKPKAS